LFGAAVTLSIRTNERCIRHIKRKKREVRFVGGRENRREEVR